MYRAVVVKNSRFFIKYILKQKFMHLYLHSFGGLAQLARALAWHARGRRFDPDTLHKGIYKNVNPFFIAKSACEPQYLNYREYLFR